jgi:hypothetical protein
MNREEELEAEISRLTIENGELKTRTATAEKQLEDAKVAVQGYIDELKRVAVVSKEMLTNVGTIQDQGWAVRRRLAKVNMAFLAADNLVNAWRVGRSWKDVDVLKMEAAYTEAKKNLETSDAQPDNPAEPQ